MLNARSWMLTWLRHQANSNVIATAIVLFPYNTQTHLDGGDTDSLEVEACFIRCSYRATLQRHANKKTTQETSLDYLPYSIERPCCMLMFY
jgi:hypothetical protein